MGGNLGVAGSSQTRTSLISSHELKTFKRKKRRGADLFDVMGKPCWSTPLPEIQITEPPWGEDEAYDDAFAGQDQAWVTLATNDTYALGALVLGASLRKAGTSRQLAILITSTVSPAMRKLLESSFDLVQEVNPFDSEDAAHLAVLKRPELGITFTKIHCWTLTQYTKCVFLDADTLILSNCDELFQRPELSAVPDVGWPDCFNSGVFVFVPSLKTFEDLVSLADREGSYDGGDQGLLNSYFSDWATKDIARHLSFIYNMNSNAFYSYLPAFLKFGHNVKIVHFLGARKPWHYSYNLLSNHVDCDCGHYQQHLQLWWDIFMSHVQPRLSTDCAGLAGEMSKLSIRSAEELRSFPADQILGSEGRQFAWERGQIDYMGADAFANIQKKLDAAMTPSQGE
ncbi:glycogenin-1 [Galendromus occidentalis]|uniref:glycogenin glucosyltransferase n=1 Tax=Galendromus occidentalis TaxID=34638 RepID=A0AAJ7SGQ0_9ACAR|nr:glycogenin-1 [Galendromus occidentalis]